VIERVSYPGFPPVEERSDAECKSRFERQRVAPTPVPAQPLAPPPRPAAPPPPDGKPSAAAATAEPSSSPTQWR
jgi:hypothetical protein